MTILLTGSIGKTSRRIAEQLHDTHPLMIASRTGTKTVKDIPGVAFDWNDYATHTNPFNHPQAQASPITAIYLVCPERTLDVYTPMIAFMDLAKAKGVRRMVLLTTGSMDANTPIFLGPVHKYLSEMGIEWGVVRPNWFDENFSELYHLHTVRDESAIYTAAGSGKAPFISAEDIARVAVRMLIDEKPHNTDHVVVGPELLDHDDLAEQFTNVLGRKVRHVRLTPEGKKGFLMKYGFPEDYAAWSAELHVMTARGDFEEINDTVEKVTGQKPMTFAQFIENNREIWC